MVLLSFFIINYVWPPHLLVFVYLQVYLVFRSGGKPPEGDSMGLGVKSSGAKFIHRSQARPLTNPYPSTATSSTTPLGTNIGMLCRLLLCIHACMTTTCIASSVFDWFRWVCTCSTNTKKTNNSNSSGSSSIDKSIFYPFVFFLCCFNKI